MADQKLSVLTTIPAVDRATDLLYVVDTSGGTSNKVTVNQLLGITGAPVGNTDVQTITNKTITAPTISSPVLSGTITGTYTIGGTPTFPAAVVTLTGSQTLTNKILTSPTINTATISNPTLTVDSINEFTSTNGVTVDGLNIKDGKLNTSNSVVTANITNNTVTPAKRSGGFYISSIPTTSLGSTGNISITGVGFTPKLVRFAVLPTASATSLNFALGAMTSLSQYYSASLVTSGPTPARMSGTDAAMGWLVSTSALGLKFSYVSMDSDGFTINIITASNAFPIAFEAYA